MFGKILLSTFILSGFSLLALAETTAPFSVKDGMFDQNDQNTLGLDPVVGGETFTVYSPTASSAQKFCNGIVMCEFKGALYCMWQSSAANEDASDTFVAYARSTDGGQTWSEPMTLAETLDNGYTSSGGWISTDDKLIGFINTWPGGLSPKGGYTRYVASDDGLTWTAPADVTMADGSTLTGIFEQDPYRLSSGRIINSAHFQPGLKVCPIYTDDKYGISGWKKGGFTHQGSGDQSRELEPSQFVKSDGSVVMIFRDQGQTTYRKLASSSSDNGESWTSSVLIENMPDARTKQSAGNLPDGTAFMVGNPVDVKSYDISDGKTRVLRRPLVITLSSDGNYFDVSYIVRYGTDDEKMQTGPLFSGTAKRPGYHYPKSMVAGDYLYIAYATNKEDVQYTRIPLKNISLNDASIDDIYSVTDSNVTINLLSGKTLSVTQSSPGQFNVEIYSVSGNCMKSFADFGDYIKCDLSTLSAGVYIVRVSTDKATECKSIYLR